MPRKKLSNSRKDDDESDSPKIRQRGQAPPPPTVVNRSVMAPPPPPINRSSAEEEKKRIVVEQRKRQEEEDRRKRDEEERIRRDVQERKRQEEEEAKRKEEIRRQKEEEERQRREMEEEERQRQEAEKKAQQELELRRKKMEEELHKKMEDDKRRAEERKKKIAEERLKKQEEERLRLAEQITEEESYSPVEVKHALTPDYNIPVMNENFPMNQQLAQELDLLGGAEDEDYFEEHHDRDTYREGNRHEARANGTTVYTDSSRMHSHRSACERGPTDERVDEFLDTLPVPRVPILKHGKKDGVYMFGARIMKVQESSTLYVLVGNKKMTIREFIDKFERVEHTRLKGFQSAMVMMKFTPLVTQ